MKTSIKARISMLASAILMGNVGLLISLLGHFPTHTIVLLRGLSGSIFMSMFIIVLVFRKKFSPKFLKETFKLHWKLLLIIGIINPIILLLYFQNILLSGYAIAAFLLYTSGIFAILFLIIGKVEKVSKWTILSFVLATVGVALIMEFWNGVWNLGIFLGILSGLLLGVQVFLIKKIYIKREKKSSEITTEGDMDTLLAWFPTLFIIFVFLPFGAIDLVRLTMLDIIWVMLLGIFPTAIAFILYNVGIKHDVGGNVIILSYIEPFVATINTIIFMPTLFSPFTIAGGGLILIANIFVIIFSRLDARKKEAKSVNEGGDS